MLGLALNFGLTWGWVVTCCFKCRCNNSKFILLLAVLDAFMGISEDFASENQPQEILVPMIKHELLCDYVTNRNGV